MLNRADLEILNRYLPVSCQGILKSSVDKISSLKQSSAGIKTSNRKLLNKSQRSLYQSCLINDSVNGWQQTKCKPSLELDLNSLVLLIIPGCREKLQDGSSSIFSGYARQLSPKNAVNDCSVRCIHQSARLKTKAVKGVTA